MRQVAKRKTADTSKISADIASESAKGACTLAYVGIRVTHSTSLLSNCMHYPKLGISPLHAPKESISTNRVDQF